MAHKCCKVTWEVHRAEGDAILELYCPICFEPIVTRKRIEHKPFVKTITESRLQLPNDNTDNSVFLKTGSDIVVAKAMCKMCKKHQTLSIETNASAIIFRATGKYVHPSNFFESVCAICGSELDEFDVEVFESLRPFDFGKKIVKGG